MAYELTEREKDQICKNSIERVINTTIRLLELEKMHNEEYAAVNYEDWIDLKVLTVKLWDRERNAIFTERMEAAKKEAKS